MTKQRTIDRVGGGDSIINLTLHVKSNKIEVSYEADITLGQTYLFGCEEITPTALGDVTKQRTIDRVGGGDSIINLTLHVKSNKIEVSYEADITLGQTYLFGCEEITPTALGDVTKQRTIDRVGGGDSIINLVLHVKSAAQDIAVSYESTINVDENLIFGCQVYTFSVTGPQVLTNKIPRLSVLGDSIITLNLTVQAGGSPTKEDITVQYEADLTLGQTYLFGCEEITPAVAGDVNKQRTIDRVGTYGDSIINLILHVKPAAVEVQYEADLTLGQTYLFGCEEITPTAIGDVTKQRTIDQVGGGDSIINLILHVKGAKIEVQYEADINLGQTYLFGCEAITPTAIGDVNKQRTIDRVNGGDSIINLILHVKTPCDNPAVIHHVETHNICTNEPLPYKDLEWNKTFYTRDTTYNDTLVYQVGDKKGCDSIVQRVLASVPATYKIQPVTNIIICDGDSYTWKLPNGKEVGTYNTTQIVKDSIPDPDPLYPCDSLIYELNLTVQTAVDLPATDTVVCNGTSFVWKDLDGNVIGTYTTSQTGLTHVVKHKVINTAGTYCDSLRYTLNLTVLPAMTKEVRQDTICYNSDYTWNDEAGNLIKTLTAVKANVKDTVYRQFAGTECDSIMNVLLLVVHDEAKTIPTEETISFGADYTWKDQDMNVIKTYTDVEKSLTDKHVVATADGKCDSLIYTLSLKVKPIDTEETSISATVCAGSTYKSRLNDVLITKDTTWSETLRVKKDGAKVDSVYNYTIYIFRNPSILPTTLVDSVRAVCGYPLDTATAQAEIKAYLKANFNVIHVDPDAQIKWYVKRDGKFVPKAKDIISGGISEVEFQCIILDQCGNKLAIDKTIPVLDPDMVLKPGILVEKYGHWLLMLHVNNLVKEGFVFTEQDVDWYQEQNGVEKKLDYHGYYYTANEELVGNFYVIINATNATGCNAAIKSNTVDWSTPMNAPMRLVPNFGHEGTMMRLENLNPNNEYQIYAYDEAGVLIRQMSVSGQAMTEIRAEGIPGIYMLRVVTDEKVETLRYIIK